MSMLGHVFFKDLKLTASVMAIPLAILFVYFEVKPEQRPQLSRRAMAAAIFFLTLFVLCLVNLYVMWDIVNENRDQPADKDPLGDSTAPSGQDGEGGSEQGAGGTGHTIISEEDLSPEELLVKQNWDEIQRLKAEYSEADTETFSSESGSVDFHIYEKAGYIFQDLMQTGDYIALKGKEVSSAKVVIMDYFSDTIISTLRSEERGYVRYSHGNQEKFYGIIFHDDYDIYVTCPLRIVSGEECYGPEVFLEKRNSQYTPLFQLRLYTDIDPTNKYSTAPFRYGVEFCLKDAYNNEIGGNSYHTSMYEDGVLSWGDKTYFSLNTSYIIDISLHRGSGKNQIESTHQTFDGTVTSSNQIDLLFEFDQEDSGT